MYKTFKKTVTVGNYEFRFQEADEQAYIRDLKDGENHDLIIFVDAFDKASGKLVASYEKEWESADSTTARRFAGRFCRDAKFRAKCQTDGPTISDVLPKQDRDVHPECARAVARLNAKGPSKLKFKDFAALKTYGQDKVSRMKLADLECQLPPEDREELARDLGDDGLLKVLRWIRRGLARDLAVRKVRTDLEIARNAR